MLHYLLADLVLPLNLCLPEVQFDLAALVYQMVLLVLFHHLALVLLILK